MDLATLERAAEEAPIIKLVNLVLTDAVKRGASDIHIEPYERELRVRFRAAAPTPSWPMEGLAAFSRT
jgi:type IV pilus assembly protein PilB